MAVGESIPHHAYLFLDASDAVCFFRTRNRILIDFVVVWQSSTVHVLDVYRGKLAFRDDLVCYRLVARV